MVEKPWIYLLRHGETDSRGQKRFVGQIDVPLSERGIAQALWWRKQWESTSFARVHCSDLVRSQRTAEIVVGGKEGLIEISPQFREINLGQWEGLSLAQVNSSFPDEWQKRGSNIAEYRPAGGESFADLAARIIPVFERIATESEKPVLLVGHAGVNRVILCHVLRIPLKNVLRLGQDYGALNIIEPREDGARVPMMNVCPELA